MHKRFHLSSPAHVTLLTFVTLQPDTVEIYETRLGGTKRKERELPYLEAVNYRARLIHQGWTEFAALTES
jgi:hypothetical protein